MLRERGGRASVVVVGAGVAGLTSAILLARAGVDVVLIERDPARPPQSVQEAVGAWSRPGLPQIGNGHAFHGLARQVLAERLPDVLNALLDVGVTERRFYLGIPEDQRVSTDLDLVSLQSRRAVVDWILYRAALEQAGLRLLSGRSVVEFDGGPEGIGGVLLDDGSRVRCHWIVDATGHRRTLRQARHRIGMPNPRTSMQPARTFYYARHFRRLPVSVDGFSPSSFGLSGDLGYLRFSVLEEDSNVFVVTINSSAGSEPIRGLRSSAGWQAAADVLPGLRGLLRLAEPISDVHSFTGRGNILVEPDPDRCLPGLLTVGDALCQTNPTQGWGVSIALKAATLLADDIVGLTDDRRRVTEDLTLRLTALVRPFFEAASAEDRERLSELAGGGPAVGPQQSTLEPDSALFCRRVIYQLGPRDVELFRAAQQRIHLFADPLQLAADRELTDRAAALFRAQPEVEQVQMWPERHDMQRLVSAANDRAASVAR